MGLGMSGFSFFLMFRSRGPLGMNFFVSFRGVFGLFVCFFVLLFLVLVFFVFLFLVLLLFGFFFVVEDGAADQSVRGSFSLGFFVLSLDETGGDYGNIVVGQGTIGTRWLCFGDLGFGNG